MYVCLKLLLCVLLQFAPIIDCEFNCENEHCCRPKTRTTSNQNNDVISNDFAFTESCHLLSLVDCLANSDACDWDCTPTDTQQRDTMLQNAGYSKKTFRRLVKGNGEYTSPHIENGEIPPSTVSGEEEPQTVADVIESSKLISVDACGIEYAYELSTAAAEIELHHHQSSPKRNSHLPSDTKSAKQKQQGSSGDRSSRVAKVLDSIRRLTVFGDDDRTQIVDEDVLDFSGYLRFQTAFGVTQRCSASLIAPDIILTAAHCVHNGRGLVLGQWYSSWRFYPGLVDAAALDDDSKEIRALQAWTFGAWANGALTQKWEYDMAWILLETTADTPLLATPFLGIGIGGDLETGDNSENELHTVGYPADQDWLSRWHQICSWNFVEAHTLRSDDCDISGGSSGSPVYSETVEGVGDEEVVTRTVLCVISWENLEFNGCARITQAKKNVICASTGYC